MAQEFKNSHNPKHASNPAAAHSQATLQQAMTLHQNGQWVQAQTLYQEILKTQPEHADALHLSGVIALQTHDYQTALRLIDRAIQIRLDATFYYNRGNVLQALGHLDAAVASYDTAIALQPDYPKAYLNRGNVLKALMHLDAAVASYDTAIALQPDYAEAYSNRGTGLQALGQLDAAVASYDTAIALQPDYAEAYSNRGSALWELMQLDAAVVSCDTAIALQPDFAEAYSNRGSALQALMQLDAAVASYDRAIALKPGYAEAYSNRGTALQALMQLDAAVAWYDKAIALQPDYGEAYLFKSHALLLRADLLDGWKLHEWRWTTKHIKLMKRNFTQPLWLGDESLAGKTILLHSEQGLGDTIQFCRYAQLVADLGARVLMEVPRSLVALLKPLRGVSDVVVQGSPLPAFDYHCPLLSLPLAFKTDLNSIPCSPKYLRAEASKLTYWTSKLGKKRHPRIGLVWSGSTGHKNDHNRSIALAALIPHLPADCQYVSLQKEVRKIDKPVLESSTNILHFGNELRDFTDTAALCELMDVVISVDTSVAHLSGALGQPTWVLLPFSPDWRWLLERDDSPWYPSIKLYRQSRVGDWDSVLVKLTADLAQPKHAAPPAAAQTQATFQQALALHQNGQWVQAQMLYEEILKTEPEHY